MTTPSVEATTSGQTSVTPGLSHVLNIPAGSGNWIVAIVVWGEPSAGNTATFPSPWVQLAQAPLGTVPDGYVAA